MTTVYVVMVDDHHIDTEAFVFSEPGKAIVFAKAAANALRSPNPVDLEDATMEPRDLAEAGWLHYECFSPEGDSVWVLPREIDAAQ